MAPGDRQRTWFPEMVEALRSRWRSEMSMEEIIELRDHLDAMLLSIRQSRNILPVKTSTLCPCCQKPMFQGAAGVSVRATIYALMRFNIEPEDVVKSLDKKWNKYRRDAGIDRDGKVPHNVSHVSH